MGIVNLEADNVIERGVDYMAIPGLVCNLAGDYHVASLLVMDMNN